MLWSSKSIHALVFKVKGCSLSSYNPLYCVYLYTITLHCNYGYSKGYTEGIRQAVQYHEGRDDYASRFDGTKNIQNLTYI